MKVLWRLVGMAHAVIAGSAIALGIGHWRGGGGDVFGHAVFAAVMLLASYLFLALSAGQAGAEERT